MPVSIVKTPTNFVPRKFNEDLPEGKLSVNFAVSFDGPGISTSLPDGTNALALVYEFDATSVKNALQRISAIRSLSFVFQPVVASPATEDFPRLYIYAPDSGQLYVIGGQLNEGGAVVTDFSTITGALQILSNGSKLQFFVNLPSTDYLATLNCTVNNFNVDPFIYSSRS